MRVVAQTAGGSPTLDNGQSDLLITGAPGAGTSTVSRLVAAALSRSALLDAYFVGRSPMPAPLR